ncbi:MAG: hypothetical protein K2K25_06685 [Muribaculaceae bacterium]|nr:hypothetical protein [Muribaculaceae bacterium]
MMVCTLDQLQRDVMSRLGENPQPQPSYEGLDIPAPIDVIRQKILSLLPEIGSRLIREASSDSLGDGEVIDVSVVMRKMPCGLFAAEVKIPEDFLRVVSVKMSGWTRSVNQIIMPGDKEWSRQWSAEPGIAGNPDCPKAYIASADRGLILRLIGSEDEDDILDWVRICRFRTPENDASFYFPSSLYSALISEMTKLL